MKIRLEYVWLDGYTPEPNLRSKVKIVDYDQIKNCLALNNFPEWNFDGSSTKQAQTGSSDCILKPVRHYFTNHNSAIYILCEVMNSDGTPHKSNHRSKLGYDQEDLWFGFEQEYFIQQGIGEGILGHDRKYLDPQGKYYCGVGQNVVGREFVEQHTDMCLEYGINITGTNAEVALGQWEYQVFSKGKLKAGDDLWMSRYFLYKISEKYGYAITLHPKPLQVGEWNGSGLHTNFSNDRMRNEGGEEYFKSIFTSFENRHNEHIKAYGSDNNLRLTGNFETQSIDKFSWGVSDRGASIRVPKTTAENWVGYLEDRRPGSNADPYKIINEISISLNGTQDWERMYKSINVKIDVNHIEGKYGTLTSEELLKEYSNDDDHNIDFETMDKGVNIPTKDIEFNPQAQSDLLTTLRTKLKDSKIPEKLKNAMMYGK
jgi:glutamine synthetase